MRKNELESPNDIYGEIDTWVRPLLQQLGELEWGKSRFILASDSSETGEERGWVVRKFAGTHHYQIGVRSFVSEGGNSRGFFIRTGGDTVFSRDLTQEALSEALSEAQKHGPNHLEPPGRRTKRS